MLNFARVATSASASRALPASAMSFASRWGDVPQGPPDAILGVTTAFKEDPAETKYLLGVGAYRDNAGKPYVLSAVRKAEAANLAANMDMEYAPITGDGGFVKAASTLLFGDSAALAEGRIVGTQSISGTGAVRLGAAWIKKFTSASSVLISDPTWANHKSIMAHAGLDTTPYRYLNADRTGLDFDGMSADLAAAPEGSAVLLHACAHNPTGVDPSEEQWKAISKICHERNHLVFFDCAYQGFASGDADKDAAAVRMFVEDGHEVLVAQSFAKNMGLYGHRVGGFYLVVGDKERVPAVDSQLKILVRSMYSNPPIHGARIVSKVLGDEALRAEWLGEVEGMASRIKECRALLKAGLEKAGSTRNWDHIVDQIGMFCYSGLTGEEVDALKEKHHVYLTRDGRISMAGVTTDNAEYIAQAIHDVTK